MIGVVFFYTACVCVCQGVTYPACHGIWRFWAPPLERSRLATLAFCGSYAGVVLGMPLSGLLTGGISWQAPFYFYGKCWAMSETWPHCRCSSHLMIVVWLKLPFEKPSKVCTVITRELQRRRALVYVCAQFLCPCATFVFPGVSGIIWYFVWLWMTFEKPSKHPTISARELMYIEQSLGQSTQMAMPTLRNTPWRSFLTSMPVYAIIVANFCRSWNFYLLVLFQGQYLHSTFDLKIEEVS